MIEQQRLAEIERYLRDTQTRLSDTTQLQTERHCLWLVTRVRELEAALAEYGAHKRGCLGGMARGGWCSCGFEAFCRGSDHRHPRLLGRGQRASQQLVGAVSANHSGDLRPMIVQHRVAEAPASFARYKRWFRVAHSGSSSSSSHPGLR